MIVDSIDVKWWISQTTKDGGLIKNIYIFFILLTGCVGLHPYQARRESRCNDGDGDACYRVGWQVFHKTHKSSDDPLEWFKRGCALDDVDACTSGAYLAKENNESVAIQLNFRGKACNLGNGYSCHAAGKLTDNPQHALLWFKKGCELDQSYSCFRAGTETDKKTPESRQIRTALFQKSCKLSDGACTTFALALVNGDGIEKDVTRGVRLLNKSCDRKISWACLNLGVLHQYGPELTINQSKAREYYGRTCQYKGSNGCRRFAKMILHGWGGVNDPKKGIKMLTQQCEDKDAWSCNALGYAYGFGKGVLRDNKKSKMLFEKACNLNKNPALCGSLADKLVCGLFGERDPAKALPMLRKTCNEKQTSGCYSLAFLYQNGKVVKKDLSKAAELFKIGCDDGRSHSCHRLAHAIQDGKGVQVNPELAFQHFQTACKKGVGSACKDAIKIAEKKDPEKLPELKRLLGASGK